MIVLSLFDGISCGRVALKRANIPVTKYYASEVDEAAIAISKANHPDIIHLGDVTKWQDWDIDFSKIDLLIGGSPCQGFSAAGKGLNFNDPRSKLFFEYVNILNTIKAKNPNVKFLLENVKMKSEYKNIISEHLGVEPILIDSALVSAQRRKRYYWTNIEGVEQPNDKRIMLKDIVHENMDMNKAMSESWCKWFSNKMEYLVPKQHIAVNPDKAITMTARQYSNWQGNFIFECLNQYKIPFDDTLKILEKESKNGKIMYFNKGGQGDRVYLIHGKAITICGEGGGRGAKMGCYLFG